MNELTLNQIDDVAGGRFTLFEASLILYGCAVAGGMTGFGLSGGNPVGAAAGYALGLAGGAAIIASQP